MTVRRIWLLCAALAGFAVGVGAVLAILPDKRSQALACRPSASEALPSGPTVLILGNSLAFDANWPLDGSQTVNCARQGLTASAAIPLIETLPDIAPKAVVLVFGTVELVRGNADPDAFQADMATVVETLRARTPDTAIVILNVASMGENWSYDSVDAGVLNAAILGIDGVSVLPLDPILALHEGPVSYDGVHLIPSVYTLIRAALEAHLADDIRSL